LLEEPVKSVVEVEPEEAIQQLIVLKNEKDELESQIQGGILR
jgi:hypothetical protein